MQISAVKMTQTASKSAGKQSSSGDFGEVLSDAEKKGGTAQVISALGLVVQPQQLAAMMNQKTDTAAGAVSSGGNDAGAAAVLQQLMGNNAQGTLVIGKNTNEAKTGTEFLSELALSGGNLQARNLTAAQENTETAGTKNTAAAQTADTASSVQTAKDSSGLSGKQITLFDLKNQAAVQTGNSQGGLTDVSADRIMSQNDTDVKVQVSVSGGNASETIPDAKTISADGGSSQTAVSTAAAESDASVQSGLEILDTTSAQTAKGSDTKIGTEVKQASTAAVSQAKNGKSIYAAVTSKNAESGSGGSSEKRDMKDTSDTSDIAASSVQSRAEIKDAGNFTAAQKTDASKQVADAVKQAVDSGRTEAKLHLSPESLGGISIKIVSEGGAISLQITADNQHTGQMLASGMHELAQSLHDSGLTMNKAEVSYTGFNSFNSSFSSQQQSGQNFSDQNYSLPKWVPAMQENGSVKVIDISSQTASYTSSNSGISILA